MTDSGDLGERILELDAVLERESSSLAPDARHRVAATLVEKGEALVDLGRPEEAAACLERVVAEFGLASDAHVRDRVAVALLGSARVSMELARLDEAVERFGELASRFADVLEPATRGRVIAASLDEGVAACDALVERWGDDSDPSTRIRVATALRTKAQLFAGGAQPERELSAVEEWLERFGHCTDPQLREAVAGELFDRACLLRDLGRDAAALVAWDEVYQRYVDHPPRDHPFIALRALYAKGHNLYELGRADEAIAVCDELIARHGHEDAPRVRVTLAQTIGVKRDALASTGRIQHALAVDDALLARFSDAPEAELREIVARGFLFKLWALLELGYPEQAIAVSDQLLDRFRDETDPTVLARVSGLLLKAANMLFPRRRRDMWKLGAPGRADPRSEQGLRILTLLVARLRDSPDPELRKVMARGVIDLGAALARRGRLRDATVINEQILELGEPAIAALEELARDARDGRVLMRRQFAWALIARALVISGVKPREEALAALDDVIHRFGDDRSPLIRALVSTARDARARALADPTPTAGAASP